MGNKYLHKIIPSFNPEELFTAEQQKQLSELMNWCSTRSRVLNLALIAPKAAPQLNEIPMRECNHFSEAKPETPSKSGPTLNRNPDEGLPKMVSRTTFISN